MTNRNLVRGAMLALACGAVCLFGREATASERLFTYSYEPRVLPEGAVEFEPWWTSRIGKASGVFNRWDLRTEFEFGLSETVMTAIYLNMRGRFADGARAGHDTARFNQADTTVKGLSHETIWKLADPAADPLGVALYFEWAWDGHEFEIEPKLLLGKVLGDVTVVYNAVCEWEWEFEHEAAESKLEVERAKFLFINTLGVSVPLGRRARIGLEVVTRSRWEQFTRARETAIFAGPSLHVSHEAWWLTLTILPQWGASQPTAHGKNFAEYEQVEVRLLIGMDLHVGGAAGAASAVAKE